MKTYLKTFWRMFGKHATRLVSVFLMVLVSVGFISGIGMSTDKMRRSLTEAYAKANVPDFIVRGADGIAAERIDALRERFGEQNVETGGILEFEKDFSASMEAMGRTVELGVTFEGAGEGVTRVYFTHAESDINKLTTLDSAPVSEDGVIPVAVERGTTQLKEYKLGDRLKATVTAHGLPFVGDQTTEYEFCVTKIVQNPLHLAVRDDVSMQEDGEDYKLLESIFYLEDASFAFLGQTLSFPDNEAYVVIPSPKGEVLFDQSYQKVLGGEQAAIETIFREEIDAETAGVLTLHENFTCESFFAYSDKIEGIGAVLMVVFLLVTLLVVLSTMTRLLDEERPQIACLQTLGYSPMRIVTKYLLFALAGTLLGCVGAYFAGEGLSYLIYINFTWVLTTPPYSSHPTPLFFVASAALILVATLTATLIAGLKMTREKPSVLLRPKAPKAGKKVILERIPFLWKRLSFKYKSTLRNVLRYKTRFVMTVVSVMASTGLVLGGLAVLDACLFHDIGTSAMLGVAIVVLIFAALLNAVVIYTLTNINVSERQRELATLMVLGYYDGEVTGYIYREIYITGSIGIVLGIPFGALLCLFIFHMIEFGSLATMGWYTWLLAPVLSLLFTAIVTLLLRHRIVRIDMNDSLKAIE